MNPLLGKIASIFAAPIIFLSSLLSPVPAEAPAHVVVAPYEQEIAVGAALPQATGVFETSLAAPISSSDTSMTLTANSIRGGGSVSGYTCFTIDEGTAQAEVVCGTVSSTSVTSMTRGISYSDGTTSVAANKFSHRRGANVKITDFPIVQILKAQNNGDATFPNALSYDSGVGPVDSSDLADKEYVLSVVSGGDVSFERVVFSGTAGETLSAGNLVYLKSSDGRWWKVDADDASTVENVVLGIAQGSGTAGNSIASGVLIKGIDSNQSGLSANSIYYASNTAGGISSSAGTKEVTLGLAISTTEIVFTPRYNQVLTEDEQDAISGGSSFGTPSSTNKFITQDYLSSAAGITVVRVYGSSGALGASDTQFDITNPSGTTFRYTYDGTGTDPSISAAAFPVGSRITISGQNFNTNNNGTFSVTGSGTNYFEVTNASGAAETNKTLGEGTFHVLQTTTTWTKLAGLKYVIVESIGGGGAGGGVTTEASASGGGAGGYVRELIPASSLGSTETITVGSPGIGGNGTISSTSGGNTTFGSHHTAGGGAFGAINAEGGTGGTATGGDINVKGSAGQSSYGTANTNHYGGNGGSGPFGGGAAGAIKENNGADATGFGGGGGGASEDDGAADRWGGNGFPGAVIVTEHYN